MSQSQLKLFEATIAQCNDPAGGEQTPGTATERNRITSTAIQGLYCHVPFCFHKCHYCDFYSLARPDADPQEHARFIDRLIEELNFANQTFCLRIESVFVGGGTPTFIEPHLWRRLGAAMRELGITTDATEFTVEANPETVDDAIVAALADAGVNRASIGAQTFNEDHLKTLERWHRPAKVEQAVERLRAGGIERISLDLIYGIPGQTLDECAADLDRALAMSPTHLSGYCLTFEPNTALTQRRELGRIQPMDDDQVRAMYELILDRLDAAGFEHYEVSNWALRSTAGDHRCEHNLTYWRNRNWLGVGPSASSHVAGWRWRNVPHLSRYLDSQGQPPVEDCEHLPADRRLGEQLMLGLRLREGVDWTWLRENMPDHDERWSVIDDHLSRGLLERANDSLRLPRESLFIADAILETLL